MRSARRAKVDRTGAPAARLHRRADACLISPLLERRHVSDYARAMSDTNANELPLILFKKDLAQVMRCSERTVERYRRARKLPEPLPIPGRDRWSRDTVLTWLGSGKVGRR